ncbi:MAG: Crp/Fnr family transcriptional regulator [Pseudomonadota bacterium]
MDVAGDVHAKIDEHVLDHLPAFARLDAETRKALIARATVRRVAADETYFEQDAEANQFLLLLEGYVRFARITKEGEQVVTLYVPPGELFGIAKALAHDIHHVTARAASDGLALSWPTELWDDFCARYPQFGRIGQRTVGARMDQLQNKIVDLSTARVEQRIARALGRLVVQAGKPVSGGTEIDFPLTRQDLSELAGTTMHSVSRCLSAWERQGILQSKRRKVVVLHPSRLQEIAA